MNFFTTARLEFVEIARNDLDFLHSINMNPLVDEFNTLGIPNSLSETKTYLKGLLSVQQEKPQCKYCWLIQRKDNKQNIGICGFSLSNDRFNRGEIYYNLAPKSWGHGFATETARALVQWGFEYKHLHRIEAGVAVANKRSIKVLEKAHFQREGVRRKILPIHGEWVDNYHYATVEGEHYKPVLINS